MQSLNLSCPRFKLLVILVLFSGCAPTPEHTLPFFNSPDFTPEWITKGSGQYDSIHTIPPFNFVDQEGQSITEQTIAGKIVVADFFFTICPGICPKLTSSMAVVQKAFQNDPKVVLLSHSVTPDLDSVPRLKEYAASHNVNGDQWHLLTGNRKELYDIARQGYFADEDTGLKKGPDDFLHTENFILVDGRRRIRGVYHGTNPTEIERLIDDIKILKNED